ncbi:hypothetical protein VBG99_06815 [Clostridium perfringens]|uniref:hypothetical protein n=1 Tax=Clostridium perfringens TaxID=1502 RepID=UPI00285A45B1|nr:hypothetical protein [Clostridium perfringens]MDK0690064.1 hypothetical protein [Clostridium perfringens]MDM0746473.1 hypothetical protein [Clostridium perfringens]MDM0749405.1 hypothetical protein [Clostridium perfringens]MDM0787017.1 hypothetical protein [Clostridium perfringens]
MSRSSLEFKDYYFESYSGMLLDEDVLQDFLEVQEQDKIKKVITILIKRSLEDKKRIYKLLDILNEQSKRLDVLEQYNKDKKTEFVNVSFESIEDIMNLFR